MAKSPIPLDVLVLGQHPSAYLAAVLLLDKPSVSVAHATIPSEREPDRLTLVNPRLFQLHKSLEKVKKKLKLLPVHGLSFLSEEAATRGDFKSKSACAYVVESAEIRKAFCQNARELRIKLLTPKTLTVANVDEKGFEIIADQQTLRPKAVLLAGALPPEQARALSLPEMFSADVMRRYSFVRLRGSKWVLNEAMAEKPAISMSLDLVNKLSWAWLLPGDDEIQLAVEQPMENHQLPPAEMLTKWAGILRTHGVIRTQEAIPADQVRWMEIPAAGALSREIIGNRTLLFGPAGGFYTACMEDLYPNCWSAQFAAEAVRAALNEPHLQDALQPYREKWGTTLGEYLRGPQQNLRFLLPLVYRNPVMTSRMAESILLGKSVVR